jgi:putative zinc finger protein
MACDRVRAQLTAYLDGELVDDRGTVVRGHLRTCADCRHIAEQEAALRDGLRAMPSVDPPPSLWAGVQARLAQEEVAAAQQPAWKRALVRWSHAFTLPRLAGGGLVVAAAIALIFVKTRPQPEEIFTPPQPVVIHHDIKPDHGPPAGCAIAADDNADVTADLAAEPTRITNCYLHEIDATLAEAKNLKWSDDRRAAFDAKVATMRAAISKAPEGKRRWRAAQAMLAFTEGAVIRDDVVLAMGGAP